MSATDLARADVALFAAGSGAVLFSAQSQNLHGLNATAALIWAGLSEGLGAEDIVGALVRGGAPAEAAATWYADTIALFRLNGLLVGTAPPPSPAVRIKGFGEDGLIHVFDALPGSRLRLVLAGRHIDLEIDDPWLADVVKQMFARLVASDDSHPPATVLRAGAAGGKWLLLREGRIAEEAESAGAIARDLEAGIMRVALELADYLVAFRAALMVRDGCGLLIAGPGGAGKTMLAAGLLHRGWSYAGDELAFYRPGEAAWLGIAKSLRVYRTGWEALTPLFPAVAQAPVYGPPERPMRAFHPPGATIAGAVVSHVIFPRYRPQSANALVTLAPADGLQGLFANCAAVSRPLSAGDIGGLVGWSGGVSFHRLVAADLAGAVELLEALPTT